MCRGEVYYSEQSGLTQCIAVKHFHNSASETHFLILALRQQCPAEDHCPQWFTYDDTQMIGR